MHQLRVYRRRSQIDEVMSYRMIELIKIIQESLSKSESKQTLYYRKPLLGESSPASGKELTQADTAPLRPFHAPCRPVPAPRRPSPAHRRHSQLSVALRQLFADPCRPTLVFLPLSAPRHPATPQQSAALYRSHPPIARFSPPLSAPFLSSPRRLATNISIHHTINGQGNLRAR